MHSPLPSMRAWASRRSRANPRGRERLDLRPVVRLGDLGAEELARVVAVAPGPARIVESLAHCTSGLFSVLTIGHDVFGIDAPASSLEGRVVMTTFSPVVPTIRVPPTRIAADTWMIHSVQQALGQPLFIYLNSMLILGSEPMIVDTGTVANRAQWLQDVFSLVDPADVRWIFLSHDDVDHTGNLDETLSACPNATLVCNWAMVERHTNCFEFPHHRCRWVMDGETLDIGDRTLQAWRPPVYDSPTTRGLFDPTTGVYWSADSFATPLPHPETPVADLDGEFWNFGLMLFALGAVSPWLSLVDETKYGKYVDRVQSLDIKTIAGCHTPVIEGPFIGRAFARIRELPSLDPPQLPDQSVLDQVIAATAEPQT